VELHRSWGSRRKSLAELKERHPEIDWRRPADTRNRIVHGYWSIDLEILYNTASEHLGAMTEALTSVLAELEQSP
jgi:uncharacterized protein with HEPN domain